MRKKERDDERQVIQKRNEEEMRDKKKKHEDDKKSWQAKHDIKGEVIEVLQQELSFQCRSLAGALKVADEAKKESVRCRCCSGGSEGFPVDQGVAATRSEGNGQFNGQEA